jgi:hypothetical protein
MVTDYKRFFVIEELSSHAFCKIAAPVSPIREYPELPDLSDNPLPSYIYPDTTVKTPISRYVQVIT